MAKVIKVIYTEETRGEGNSKNDPVMQVSQFWTLDGDLICEATYNTAKCYIDAMQKAARCAR